MDGKKIFHAIGNQKKAGVMALKSVKTDFKTKTVIKDKEEHCIMIKAVIQQEDIKFANNYAFNIVVPNHINKAYIKRCNRRN